MFDAERYFETVGQVLATCQDYTELTGDPIKVDPGWSDWQLIVWRTGITFASGHFLDVVEIHTKKSFVEIHGNKKKIVHYRKAKYHFMEQDGSCIFRVDTHQTQIPFNEPCHLHDGEQEIRVEHGDPRLKGQSLIGIDFLTIFGWIHQHLDGKLFIWQQQ